MALTLGADRMEGGERVIGCMPTTCPVAARDSRKNGLKVAVDDSGAAANGGEGVFSADPSSRTSRSREVMFTGTSSPLICA